MKEIKFTIEEKQFWDSFVGMMSTITPEINFLKEKGIEKEAEEKLPFFEKISILISQNIES